VGNGQDLKPASSFLNQLKNEKMTHTYQVTGMTCGGCEATVKGNLLKLPDVTSVEVSNATKTATITMEKHIALSELQRTLGGVASKYQISAIEHNETAEQAKSWFETYKPILLIFGFVTLVASIMQINNNGFNVMQFMQHFMAGFFLVFSFFKLLDLKGFAESYAMYDVIAQRIPAWGYIYPFIELGLGLAFCINYNPQITNIVTLVVMSISIIGVLQSVLNKRKIQCACLGAVFKLPMSTVTIIEDALMIGMSATMLFLM
jgi:copper chaperone CopZ